MLTIFYTTATWLRSRRLSSIRQNILDAIANDFSLVCLKSSIEDVLELKSGTGVLEGWDPTFIASDFSKNKSDISLQKILWVTKGFRGCVLSPQQIIDVRNWIAFSKEEKYCPLSSDFENLVLTDPKLFLLIETDMQNMETKFSRICDLGGVGVPKVWRADEKFSVILESDIYHVAEMVASLTSEGPLFLREGFQIKRIETIIIEGTPCTGLKSDQLPGSGLAVKTGWSFTDDLESELDDEPTTLRSPSEWNPYIELLKRYTRHAAEAVIPKVSSKPSAPAGISLSGEQKKQKLPEGTSEELVKMDILKTKLSEILNMESRIKSASVNELPTSASHVTPKKSINFGVNAQSIMHKYPMQARKLSLGSVGSASPASVRHKNQKPPNVLVFSESPTATSNIKKLLGEMLHNHRYIIYSVTSDQLAAGVWTSNCLLLVICGNVPAKVEPSLMSYLLSGGRLLCLCSAFLHSLLPIFRTAEVREKELVRFTYGRWSRVRLMHHIFCYQNSPGHTKFSREADEPPTGRERVSSVPQTPSFVNIVDAEGVQHKLHIKILGAEETWHTPSLLLAYFPKPLGRAVFSQVHLELDPSDCLGEREEEALRHSDYARKEIMRDILSTHLGLELTTFKAVPKLTVGYFLGMHESKIDFLRKLKDLKRDGILSLGNLELKFCGKTEVPPDPTPTLLPILVHACPSNFSTLHYFEHLQTRSLGRLLFYCDVLGSSMDVINGELAHGLAVVPSQQTSGKGRSFNQWISPPGCAMFSLQIHFPVDSYLGRHPSVVQHAVAVAVILAVYELDKDYVKALNLRLKWPNDIYLGSGVKIGGVIATCIASDDNFICNLGVGINLDNEAPTTCLNSCIREYNKVHGATLRKIGREIIIAGTFTHLEKIINKMQAEEYEYFYDNYYRFWLHRGAEVKVVDTAGNVRVATIHGIDKNGFLEVQEATGKIFSVHPDGNSFDMLEGLILPKAK